MIKTDTTTGEKYIDIESLTETVEIPLKSLMFYSNQVESSTKFKYEEVNTNDSSASLYYIQNGNKVLITIYGPKETRFRDKLKPEEAIVEVYSKFNTEINKEMNRRLNTKIQNFCESLIFLEQYPRCQINIIVNVLSFQSDNEYLLLGTIFNRLMLSLSISGIDLRTFALTSCLTCEKGNVLFVIDGNRPDDILLVESSSPLSIEEYKDYYTKSKGEVDELYKRFKGVLFKRLNLN